MTIDEKLDMLMNHAKNNSGRLNNMENRMTNIENSIIDIKLTLENETNRNIKIIAEGHLDLSRKLNETIRISSDIKAKQDVQDIY